MDVVSIYCSPSQTPDEFDLFLTNLENFLALMYLVVILVLRYR